MTEAKPSDPHPGLRNNRSQRGRGATAPPRLQRGLRPQRPRSSRGSPARCHYRIRPCVSEKVFLTDSAVRDVIDDNVSEKIRNSS
jgi:hypothetical protein